MGDLQGLLQNHINNLDQATHDIEHVLRASVEATDAIVAIDEARQKLVKLQEKVAVQ